MHDWNIMTLVTNTPEPEAYYKLSKGIGHCREPIQVLSSTFTNLNPVNFIHHFKPYKNICHSIFKRMKWYPSCVYLESFNEFKNKRILRTPVNEKVTLCSGFDFVKLRTENIITKINFPFRASFIQSDGLNSIFLMFHYSAAT